MWVDRNDYIFVEMSNGLICKGMIHDNETEYIY
jgi:hypothetical protein